jgi:hypothetical protein
MMVHPSEKEATFAWVVHILLKNKVKLVGGLKLCINIYAILRLCGKFVVNLCFYHVYSFINLLSIFNIYVVQKLKI